MATDFVTRTLQLSAPDTEIIQPVSLSQLGDVIKNFVMGDPDEDSIMFIDTGEPRELCFD